MQEMTIGQLAEAAEVNVETVRYYHRRGLLPAPPRPIGGIRRYPAAILTRLRFIRRSQSLGFSLDEVEALLSLQDGQACNAARAIAEQKFVDVRQRIQDLSMLEVALATLVQRCSTSKGKVSCPLIDTLMNGDELTR
ncbi:Hg(II)-responsive transcriptional regulator [Paraburkholderia fungorum]|jgi:MerR family transcriptional regulator, mercuric resistance operon regulatory protein|uniref:Mercuric resistance operon regulatory protein n=1 Tax=Paraburkholderia fungorum TaxID=134537 RepID=A0AAW3UYP8_9BURK|nr:Hg(II)-responsive transcriptional regulator [Paraburkholderia fungorum]KFX64430.1 MerR family transcriptional regulator [Burkholderia sp. K24]MBB4515510.1 MerR family mercuric resistance operon transcriptional regulator [Paraburkholderia fungorum]MBB6203453.1 MerR family mercuric resistance operon transcriptional regulator [Paraburkholderia fungorum]MDE1009898.1 Hg(II)-responsive transcriptional regulator [Paraburkholderia fungorum]PNE56846.1 Hg(II)-responsive transcriptional regulator [Par